MKLLISFAMLVVLSTGVGCAKKRYPSDEPVVYEPTRVFLEVPLGLATTSVRATSLRSSLLEPMSSAPGAWEGPLSFANWVRMSYVNVEPLLQSIIGQGYLNRGVTFTEGSPDGKWIYRLTANTNQSVTATAISTAALFTNKFEIWRASDEEKALEMFFNDPNTISESNVLVFYRLAILMGDAYSYDDIVTESFSRGSEGARSQTLTFTGGAIDELGIFERGRVVLEEADSGATLQFRGAAKLSSSSGLCSDTTNPKYYSLGYVQSYEGDQPMTARFGVKVSDIDSAGESFGSTNTANDGIFSAEEGYINQGVTSIPSEFPTAAAVTAVYSELGTASTGSYKNTSATSLNSWSVAMKSLSAP